MKEVVIVIKLETGLIIVYHVLTGIPHTNIKTRFKLF
jgi:hypothetical protein